MSFNNLKFAPLRDASQVKGGAVVGHKLTLHPSGNVTHDRIIIQGGKTFTTKVGVDTIGHGTLLPDWKVMTYHPVTSIYPGVNQPPKALSGAGTNSGYPVNRPGANVRTT